MKAKLIKNRTNFCIGKLQYKVYLTKMPPPTPLKMMLSHGKEKEKEKCWDYLHNFRGRYYPRCYIYFVRQKRFLENMGSVRQQDYRDYANALLQKEKKNFLQIFLESLILEIFLSGHLIITPITYLFYTLRKKETRKHRVTKLNPNHFVVSFLECMCMYIYNEFFI